MRRLAAALPRGQTLPGDQFDVRHRWVVRLLWAHVAVLPAVALLYGDGILHALLEGALVVPFALAAARLPARRRWRAVIAAAGLLSCSALLVHVTDNLVEAHFHFFVAVTVLSLYEDWSVFGLAIWFVAVHHVLAPSYQDDVLMWAGVHAFFIGGLCVANVVVWRAAERTRDRLRRSNDDLREFAYVASHDLSEPLRMITSYLQLLERRHGERLDGEAREFVGYAVDGAQRMRALIDDLLEYSRVDREGETAARSRVDLSDTVGVTLRSLAASLEDARAEVHVDDLPVVEGDGTQLAQLFQNLISNAVKFRNGTDPRVDVRAEREAQGWRITVADNGIGVDPAHADRIFKMFGRLHSRDEYAGNGIGLAICRKIVDRHGGDIWVEPNPGGGSRFVFTIPD